MARPSGAIGVEHDRYAVDHASGEYLGESEVIPVLRTAVALIATVILVGMPASVFAQNATAVPSNATTQKMIGTPEASKVEPALIVMNASGALLADNKLTLTGIARNAIIFADRPTRAAGHALTVHLLEEWGDAADASFSKDPPNATVSAFSKDGSLTRDAVVVLEESKPSRRSVDVRGSGSGRRSERCGRSGIGVHRHHRPAVHAAVVRRRGASYRSIQQRCTMLLWHIHITATRRRTIRPPIIRHVVGFIRCRHDY